MRSWSRSTASLLPTKLQNNKGEKEAAASFLFHAMIIPISKRLLCCADLISHGARVADVGCDHGYLGIYLIAYREAAHVVATDLRPLPLEKAKQNAARFGTSAKMEFAVGDGLEQVQPGTVDTVVCAGMGGDTIASILEKASWVFNEQITLILQPQSSGNDLRRWLGVHGFSILEERLVEDGRFLYAVMKVRYGGGKPLTPGQQYASPQLLNGDPELVGRYLDRLDKGLRKAVDGITKAKDEEDRDRLHYYQSALEEITEVRKRNEDCT